MDYNTYLQKVQSNIDKDRVTALSNKYPGVVLDKPTVENFYNTYGSDSNAAIAGLEEAYKAKQQAVQAVTPIEDPYQGVKAAIGTGKGHSGTEHASVLRNYQNQIIALKDKYPGLNVPTGFFEQQAQRMEKPFGIFPRGSLDELHQQGEALKLNLMRILNDNFGIGYDLTRDLGWEDLLKELFRRLR